MEENVLQGKTLLVVDDEADLRDIVASEMEFMGGKVFQAENISAAQDILSKNNVDLIVSDIRMPGGTGVDLLERVKDKDVDNPPVVLITGFADITIDQAFAKGAEGLLNKPFKLDDLISVAARLTGPLKDRFKPNGLSPTQLISMNFDHEFKEDRHFSLGRGGFALHFNHLGRKFDLGEALDFHLNFTDRAFSGEGICRWVKYPETHDGGICLGIEIMSLDDKSLELFLSFREQNKSKAFIPSF